MPSRAIMNKSCASGGAKYEKDYLYYNEYLGRFNCFCDATVVGVGSAQYYWSDLQI